MLHPGHISGPGWPVITPAGSLDPAVWTALATGQLLALPGHGLGVLHQVHADDVAQRSSALSRPAAIGASFHVVAEQAMTLRGLAVGVARWFGCEPVLYFVDWAEFERRAVLVDCGEVDLRCPGASLRGCELAKGTAWPCGVHDGGGRCGAAEFATMPSRCLPSPAPGEFPSALLHGMRARGEAP